MIMKTKNVRVRVEEEVNFSIRKFTNLKKYIMAVYKLYIT